MEDSTVSSMFSGVVQQGNQGHQDGTLINPFVIHVDLEFPERNREFEVERVKGIIHKQHTHDGFHIRTSVPPPNLSLWEATIPEDFPEYWKNRVIQVKAPSRDYWFRSRSELYSKHPKIDQMTMRKLDATHLKVKKDINRQWTYYLLVFPESVELANAFSDDDFTLPRGYVPMKVPAANNKFDEDLCGVGLFWIIAEKDSGTRIAAEDDVPTDYSQTFK